MTQNEEPPNRRDFERALSHLSSDIRTKEQELKQLLGHKTYDEATSSATVGQIAQWREESKRGRRQREATFQELNTSRQSVTDYKRQLADKRQEISQLEASDLWYRNEQKLNEHLRRFEDIYTRKQFASAREERGIVQQIDKLRRNQKQLTKYRRMCEERDHLESQLNALRGQTEAVYKRLKELKASESECRRLYREGLENVSLKKKELDELFVQKRRLINDYNNRTQSFLTWSRTHPGSRVGSCPVDRNSSSKSTRRAPKLRRKPSGSAASSAYTFTDDTDSDSDGGNDFEPFVEEKRACRALINYLQRLAPSSIMSTHAVPSSKSNLGDSNSGLRHLSLSGCSSLADELPSPSGDSQEISDISTHPTKKDSGDAQANNPVTRRRSTKKDKSRKGHQSVPYDPQTLQLFSKVDIDAPIIVNDIPAAVESLKEKLKFYEDQIRLPPETSSTYWQNAFGIGDRLISSESDMTIDSARFSYLSPSDADDSFSVASCGTRAKSDMEIKPPVFRCSESEQNLSEMVSETKDPDRRDSDVFCSSPLTTNEPGGILFRVPTADEGIADIAMDNMSKGSSSNDSSSMVKILTPTEAAEVCARLELLKLDRDDDGN